MGETVSITGRDVAVRFNDQELLFLRSYANSGDISAACLISGYTEKEAGDLLGKADCTSFIRKAIADKLVNVMAPKAAARLSEAVDLGKSPDRGQMDAVKTILDRTGFIAPKATDPERNDLGLNDLTTEQLHRIATGVDDVIAERSVPVAPVDNTQVIEALK